jgi:hypothetical protein
MRTLPVKVAAAKNVSPKKAKGSMEKGIIF